MDSFRKAAVALSIAANDNEIRSALAEAVYTHMPDQIRRLFAILSGVNIPTDARTLWDEFCSINAGRFHEKNGHLDSNF